jgi:tetratricopeptide (TPR) repeat protein
MLLGKGHKFLESGRYQEALAKALKAKNLKLEEQFEWLCHSIEGKSRYHLGDKENALIALRRAKKILASKLEKEKESKPLQNILNDVIRYIEKIEHGDTP